MFPAFFHLDFATFMLGGNIGHDLGQINKFFPAVVGLHHDAFPRFGDVMFETHLVFHAQHAP